MLTGCGFLLSVNHGRDQDRRAEASEMSIMVTHD